MSCNIFLTIRLDVCGKIYSLSEQKVLLSAFFGASSGHKQNRGLVLVPGSTSQYYNKNILGSRRREIFLFKATVVIGDLRQYLEGQISTWKDCNRNIGFQMERNIPIVVIGDLCQYLEGPISTWKDCNGNIGVQKERNIFLLWSQGTCFNTWKDQSVPGRPQQEYWGPQGKKYS